MIPLSFNTAEEPIQEPLSWDTGVLQPQPLSPEVASVRAEKADFAFRNLVQKNYDDYRRDFMSAREAEVRKEAAANADMQKAAQRERLINDVVRNNKGPISQDQFKFIQDRLALNSQRGFRTNPDTVMEEYFSGEYLKFPPALVHGTFLADALKEVPRVVETARAKASDLTTKSELFGTMYENVVEEAKNQSWLGWTVDQLELLFPFSAQSRLGVFWRGSGMEERVREIARMPLEQAKEAAEAQMTYLKGENIALALEFARALKGISKNEVLLGDAFTVLDATIVGAPLKSLFRAGRAGLLARQTNKAFEHMTRALDDIETAATPVPAEIPRGQMQNYPRPPAAVQMELFPEGTLLKDQGSFRFMAPEMGAKEQVPPTEMSKMGPGKLRTQLPSTRFETYTEGPLMKPEGTFEMGSNKPPAVTVRDPVTGRMGKPYSTQGELPLPQVDHQTAMLLEAPMKQPVKVAVNSGAGDIKEATVQKATAVITREMEGNGNPVRESLEGLLSVLRTSAVKLGDNPGRFGQEGVTRLRESYNTLITNLENAILKTIKVEAIPLTMSVEKTVRTALEVIKDTYPGIKNSILDRSRVYQKNGKYYSDFNIGDGLDFFDKEETALNFIKHNKLPNATAEQQGFKFYVKMRTPVDISDSAFRDYTLIGKELKIPASMGGAMKDWIRTPNEVLSIEHDMIRKVADYAPANYIQLMKDASKAIQDLYNGRVKFDPVTGDPVPWFKGRLKEIGEKAFPTEVAKSRFSKGQSKKLAEWDQLVRYQMRDEKTGVMRDFLDNPGQLDHLYQTAFKHFPDPDIVDSYFALKKMVETDTVFRNIAAITDKHRVGAMSHTLDMNGIKISFDGMKRDVLPGGNNTVLILDGGTPEVTRLDQMKVGVREKFKNDILHGKANLIEVYKPVTKPLEGFGPVNSSHQVEYVLTNKVETKPLSWNQVTSKELGGLEYDYDFYIKQARIRPEDIGGRIKHWYEGDTTLMAMANGRMGRDVAKKLNQVRILLQNNKPDEARLFAEKNLPISWKEIDSWFKPTLDAKGATIPPRLDLNEPIQLVSKRDQIGSMNNELRDRYKDPNNPDKFTFYDATRQGVDNKPDPYEIFTVRDKGTRHNPLYAIEPVTSVDPLTTMNRSLNKIINSPFLNEYKAYSVNEWLRNATPYLVNATEKSVSDNPYYHFYNAKLKKGGDAKTADFVERLEIEKYHIQQLLGVPSKVETELQRISQTMSDWAYEKAGPKGLVLEPAWNLAKITKGSDFLGAMTFHNALGLFNYVQVAIQSVTHSTIFAIAGPKYAVTGARAALLHQWTRINSHPNVLAEMDAKMTKQLVPGTSTWKAGEFTEAYHGMQNVGFGKVGAEHSFMQGLGEPKLISHGTMNFLDAATLFFKGSERHVRYGAWYTAYREYRDKFPTGAFGDRDWARILLRADQLAGDMSRSSRSMIQNGVMSWPTQFLGYQIRQMEQFTGKRLDGLRMENGRPVLGAKGRLFAVNTALYGFPAATGLLAFPLGDYIRKSAIDNGYIAGDNFINDFLMNGGPAALYSIVSGGFSPNFGQRYGANGMDFFREGLHGDKPWWTLIGGARLSTMQGALESMGGFFRAFGSALRDGQESLALKPQDLVDPLKNIAGIRNPMRLYDAIQTGRYMSRKEMDLDEISTANAIFTNLTGTQSQKISDTRFMMWSNQDEQKAQKEAGDYFVKEMRRGIAIEKDYPQQATEHYKRALKELARQGFPDNRFGELMAKVTSQDTLVSRMEFEWAFGKDVNQLKREARQEQFGRKQQLGK